MTHKDIVKQIGARVLSEALGVPIETARSWGKRNSIPAKYWHGVIKASQRVVTMTKLMDSKK